MFADVKESSAQSPEFGSSSTLSRLLINSPSDIGLGQSVGSNFPPVSPSPAPSPAPSIEITPSRSVAVSPVSLEFESPTIHSNPGWLPDLKKNFMEEIIEPCTTKVKKAVKGNVYIEVGLWCNIMFGVILINFQDDKEFDKIRNDIINSVMYKLEGLHRGIGKPGKELFKCKMIAVKIYFDREANHG